MGKKRKKKSGQNSAKSLSNGPQVKAEPIEPEVLEAVSELPEPVRAVVLALIQKNEITVGNGGERSSVIEDVKALIEVIPNGGDRFMLIQEKEQDHRHERERAEDSLNAKLALRGQQFGGWITAALVVGALIFGSQDKFGLAVGTFAGSALVQLGGWVMNRTARKPAEKRDAAAETPAEKKKSTALTA